MSLAIYQSDSGAFAVLQEDQELLKHALKPTLTVAVSGAAGQIAQHLLFMVRISLSLPITFVIRMLPCAATLALDAILMLMQLASGGCFGMDQPIAFRLLASRQESLAPLEGMAMELEDSLYPLLRKAQPSFSL